MTDEELLKEFVARELPFKMETAADVLREATERLQGTTEQVNPETYSGWNAAALRRFASRWRSTDLEKRAEEEIARIMIRAVREYRHGPDPEPTEEWLNAARLVRAHILKGVDS